MVRVFNGFFYNLVEVNKLGGLGKLFLLTH